MADQHSAFETQANEDITGQDFLKSEDQFDLFCDFMESDEWILPIQSFSDYFCIIFATNDLNEHRAEKEKVYEDFKQIANANLNQFLKEILNISKDQLAGILRLFHQDIEFDDLMFLLAVEDYKIFHGFMFEANQDLDRQAQRRKMQGSMQMQGNMTVNDEAFKAAMAASMEDESRRKTEHLSEDEQLRRALEESKMLEQKQKLEEDEILLAVMKASQESENERKINVQTKRKETLDAKRQELAQEQEKTQEELHKSYKENRQDLLKEEQEARRKLMLEKLRAQALEGEKKLKEAQEKMKGQDPLNPFSKLPALGGHKPKAVAPIVELAKDEDKQESLEERKLRLEARRDALQKQKQEEEQKREEKPDDKQRDAGDVFRRTGMKYGESEEEKQKRLNRCLNVLKNTKDTGAASEFKGLNVGDPLNIDFANFKVQEDSDSEDGGDVTAADITILQKGKKIEDQ